MYKALFAIVVIAIIGCKDSSSDLINSFKAKSAISDMVTVDLKIDYYSYTPYSQENKYIFHIDFTNKTEKVIGNVAGSIAEINPEGKHLNLININSGAIGIGGHVDLHSMFSYNRSTIEVLQTEGYTKKFHINSITFADGAVLNNPK